MNYEEMSKPELCALVAKKWFDDVISHGSNCDGSIYLNRASEEHLVDFDPINNPSDAWPIIVSSKICMQWYEDDQGVYASASVATSDERNDSFISDDENPLRAAMICFLKMKGAEK